MTKHEEFIQNLEEILNERNFQKEESFDKYTHMRTIQYKKGNGEVLVYYTIGGTTINIDYLYEKDIKGEYVVSFNHPNTIQMKNIDDTRSEIPLLVMKAYFKTIRKS